MHPPSISHYQMRTATFPAHSNILYMLTTSHYLHTSFLYFSLLFNSLLHVCFNFKPHSFSGILLPLIQGWSAHCYLILASSYNYYTYIFSFHSFRRNTSANILVGSHLNIGVKRQAFHIPRHNRHFLSFPFSQPLLHSTALDLKQASSVTSDSRWKLDGACSVMSRSDTPAICPWVPARLFVLLWRLGN